MTSRPRSSQLHPSWWIFAGSVASGGAFAALALATAGDAPAGLTAAALVGSVVFSAHGMWGLLVGQGVLALRASVAALQAGRMTEAEAALDTKAVQRVALLRRSAAYLRALIAFRRADLQTAARHADAAVAEPLGVFGRSHARLLRLTALALRAIVLAARGDVAARHDIARVRSIVADPRGVSVLGYSDDALFGAVAHAELAHAMLLQRSGDSTALREHLLSKREAILEGSSRRERALLRAYEKMLDARTTTAYRAPAPAPAAGPEEPELADWMANVAPAAAAHAARVLEVSTSGRDRPPTPPGERRPVPPQPLRRFALAGALGLSFVLLLGFRGVMSSPPLRRSLPPPLVLGFVFLVALPIALVALVGWVRRLLALVRGHAAVTAATARLTRGDRAGATEAFGALASSTYWIVAAQAHLGLAHIAERDGDLDHALEHCDRGLTRISGAARRAAASDRLLPSLMATRALVLAALDRPAEAEAELAAMPPSYVQTAAVRFSVRVVTSVRQGDVPGAARSVAAASPDLELNPRVEMLCDATRALASERTAVASREELRRLSRELRAGTALRRWMDVVAPRVVEAVSRDAHEDGRALGRIALGPPPDEENPLVESEVDAPPSERRRMRHE